MSVGSDIELKSTEVKKARLMVEFSDGYTFRNLIEYLKNTNTTGNLIFNPSGITYQQENMNKDLLNHIEIRKEDLPSYIVNPSPGEEAVHIGATMSELRPLTRCIGKKDGVRLVMSEESPLLYIQVISQFTRDGNKGNTIFYRPHKVDQEYFSTDVYSHPETDPTCTISIAEFSRVCGALHVQKCKHVIIKGYPKGVLFEGMLDGDILVRESPFGDCTPAPRLIVRGASESKEETFSIKVNISNIKPLSRLSSISPNGTVKMYFEQDKPFKIICNIGTYGTLRIFLRASA